MFNYAKNIILTSAMAAMTLTALPVTSTQALSIGSPFKNCGGYAGSAVNQQVKNLQLGCGFNTPGWNTDFQKHKNWCQTQGLKAPIVGSEYNGRRMALHRCTSKKLKIAETYKSKLSLGQKNCSDYALIAVQQNQMNQNLQCGFNTNNWSSNFNEHKNWCMQSGVSNSQTRNEASIRANALKNCIKSQP